MGGIYSMDRFTDLMKACGAFQLDQTLMTHWDMTTSHGKIVGPNQKQLLPGYGDLHTTYLDSAIRYH